MSVKQSSLAGPTISPCNILIPDHVQRNHTISTPMATSGMTGSNLFTIPSSAKNPGNRGVAITANTTKTSKVAMRGVLIASPLINPV